MRAPFMIPLRRRPDSFRARGGLARAWMRALHGALIWAAVQAAGIALAAPDTNSQAASSLRPPSRPMVFAAYYVWYRLGDHPRLPWANWTRPEAAQNPLAQAARLPGEPPLSSAARPLIGLYDSADPEVARWHVRLAQAAGVDAFLVSWWGGYKQRDQAFESGILAAARQEGFKIALFDELAQFHRDFDSYQAGLTRALRQYKDSPAYLRVDNRPVVYLYQVGSNPGLTSGEFTSLKRLVEAGTGPVYWIVDKIAHDPKAQQAGDGNRLKRIPEDWLGTPGMDAFGFYSTFSNFRAHEYDALIGKYRYLAGLAHGAGRKMLLPVHPGHDNSHFKTNAYLMPRRDGQTFRDYLRAATDAGADFILVTSWNEWPETTVIEPSSSWPDPYRYLKILAEWKGRPWVCPREPERLKAGASKPSPRQ